LFVGLNVYSFLTLRAVCSEGLESLLSMKEDLEEKRSETYGVQLKDTVYRYNTFLLLIEAHNFLVFLTLGSSVERVMTSARSV
jgi:hypothetical protein